MSTETTFEILNDADTVAARAAGRELAAELGFSRTDATLVATAISELARNIVVHAGSGEIELRSLDDHDENGLVVVARDSGPGIPDVRLALEDGWGSADGLGLGLPGARRLMDEFEIDSEPGKGTTVTMKKWRARDPVERLHSSREDGVWR
jgi:serine/threonine-protein kinase RsbT